jgi:hypothetical protein
VYIKFGAYQHADNECDVTSFNIQRMYSPRNKLFFQRYTLAFQGHMCVTGQAAISAAIEELEAAYKIRPGGVNGSAYGMDLDAGLYLDTGVASAHFLKASTSINGVRVQSFNYNKDEGGEFATGRSYAIVLQADYLNPESQIYSFSEQVQFIGNLGPKWELVPMFYGPPQVEFVHEMTVQHIIQSGEAVGIQAHPFIPGPLMADNYKHGDESFWERGSAQMIGAHALGLLFPIRWRYVFSAGDFKHDFDPHYDFPVVGIGA